MGTIDFVAPNHCKCHSTELKEVFLTNKSRDAREHTNKYQLVPFNSAQRNTLLKLLLTGPFIMPGVSLYLPIALSLARIVNQNSMIPLPREVPQSTSVAWPLSIFSPQPSRFLPRVEIIEEGSPIKEIEKIINDSIK